MKSREREPAIWLGWTGVFQKENADILRLLFGLPAQTAFTSLEGFRTSEVAMAGDDIGASGKGDQRQK